MWFLNAFTWSRALGNVVDPLTASRGFSGSPQDFYNLNNNYGPLQYDIPIINNTALTWTLPIGRKKQFFSHVGSVTNQVIGGWQLALYNQYHSGPALTPNFTPSGAQELSNSGGVQYRPFFAVDTTGSVTGTSGASLRSLAHKRLHIPGHPEAAFCDSVYASEFGCTVAFATANPTPAPNPASNAANWSGTSGDPRGNVPNGFLRGDPFEQFDAALNKKFALPWESSFFELRIQFYNVLNKTNFTPPGMTCCSTSFGRVTSTYGQDASDRFKLVLRFEVPDVEDRH